MKNIIRVIRNAPKRSGIIATLVAAVAVPAMLVAWGPSRPTFTMANPASYVTFNSITDNPKHGDERNFVQIRDYTSNGQFGENVDLVPGNEYEVYVFYHNNASSDLNDAANDYKGIAQDSFMRVQMPATVAGETDARVTGFVGASNATPEVVWDEAYGKNTSSSAVALRYVPNSAEITSNGAINGNKINLTELASSDGAKLGYDAFDGKVPGCTEFSGYVTYRFKVDQPNFEITKDVSVSGENKYSDSVAVDPASKVDFKIKYKNVGTVIQENVTIKDKLPAGLTYVKGSTYYSSSKTNNEWTPTETDSLVASGIDFGAFAPGGALYVKFTAMVASNDDLEKCDENKFVNTAHAITKNGTKHDTAEVVTDKECEEKPEEIKVCDLDDLTIKTISKDEYDANRDRYTTDLSKCKEEPPVTPEPPVEPETPVTELPETGLANAITGVFGLGSLTAASYYYLASRRS